MDCEFLWPPVVGLFRYPRRERVLIYSSAAVCVSNSLDGGLREWVFFVFLGSRNIR